jgi:Protein of unknown function (DUF3659)
MAPSPAAGKGAKGAPETPTKAGKNPASSTTPTLGKTGDQVKDTASSAQKKTPGKPPKLGASKANTPKAGTTDSPKLPPRPKDADKPVEDVKEKAPATEDVAEETESEAGKIAMNDNDPEETPGKITQQAGAESSAAGDTDLSEAAPDPVDDDADDEDTVAGAKDTVDDTADDVADDVADDEAEETDTGDAQGTAAGALGGATSAAEGITDQAEDAKDTAGDAAEDATNGDAAKVATDGAQDTAEGAVDTAEDTAEGAEETVEDAGEDVQDAAAEATNGAPETAEAATDELPEGEEAVNGVEDTAEDAAGGVEGATDEVEGATDEVDDAVDDAADEVEEAADEVDLPEVPLSLLRGLEVGEGGQILDRDGEPLGQLDEGDPEDLIGQTIGDDGEILDEDGDVIGRCSILPEKVKELAEKAKQEAEEAEAKEAADQVEGVADEAGEAAEQAKMEVPDIGILEGLKVGEGGEILDSEGKAVGKITEGDPEDFIGQEINAEGEVLDEDGDVIGRAEALPQEVKDVVDELTPDLTIVEGKKLNKKGNILDDEGEILAKLIEGDPKECAGKIPNEKGEILNDKGEVIGKVEIVQGEAADEAMKELNPEAVEAATDEVQGPSITILEGLKVNKKGEVLDEDGEPIGRLIQGELADVAGKKINEKGEIVDKDGKVLGKVELLQKAEEAADAAQDAAEDAKGAAEEAAQKGPDFSLVEGLKINKKGEVINEDGDVIARLGDGFDLANVTGKKLNDKGEVVDSEGNVIGKVDMIPQEGEEVEEAAEEAAEEDMGPELPPLSILDGLKCNKYGKIVDASGNPVGELVEGDAKRIAKLGATCDSEGQFWDGKGKIIGRAKTLPQEDDEEEGAFAGLEGLVVVKDGWVEDINDNRVGKIVEGDPKKLVGRHVDEDGDVIDKRGNVVGHAERYDEPEEEAAPPPDLSILSGLILNKQGNVIGHDGVPIARLVEGNAKELAGRKVDGEGQIWNDSGKVVGRCELIPENEREAKPEGPFAGLEGVIVVKDGLVEDEDGNVVGKVVEGDPKKLVGRAVDEDGDIIDKYGNAIGHCEPYEIPEEEVIEEDLSSLAGKVVNKQGNVVDEHGTIFGRIREGDPKAMAGRKVDGKGQIWSDDGKVIGYAELIPGGEQQKGDGPFSGFDTKIVVKDGLVHDAAEQIIGRVIEGDPKKLMGRHVDDDGDIVDKNGNVIGKAERWEPEEKERHINPMSGHKVNKEGEVRDENGELLGKLTEGDLRTVVGFEVDDNGYVIDNDGNRVGACTLLENLQEDDGPSEEELAAVRAEEENREIARKMCAILQQTLEKMEPILKQITEVSLDQEVELKFKKLTIISTSKKPTAPPKRSSTKKSSSTKSSPSSKKVAASSRNATVLSVASIPMAASPPPPKPAPPRATPPKRSIVWQSC